MGVSVGYPSMYDRILLPVDGSDCAERAADRAIELAAEQNAEIYLLSVIDTVEVPEPAFSSVELVTDAMEDEATTNLARIAARAKASDVDVTTRLCHGVPEREILDHADGVDADLIVMGRRGRSHTRNEGNVVRRVRRATGRELRVVE